MEKCVTASRYNLVENGDFRYTTAWSASSGRTTASAPAPELSANVYKLTGTATATNRLSQTVTVSGSAGDTFVLAGWAMGNSVPLDAFDTNPREFGLILTFTYTDGTTGSTTVRFNPYVTNWQYAAGFATAEKAYSSVKVELAYDYNLNSAIFDGIQLFKEEFGSQYTYDANGNVTAATDVQGGTTTYTYDSNQNLTSVQLPDNTTLTYTYYENTHNVKTAETQTGVKYEFTYDAYGNNTSVSIVSGTNKITSSAAYSTDGNRLVSTTDTVGNVTTYSYNANTNVLEWVKYPTDTASTWNADGTVNVQGNETFYTYDEMYRLATATEKVNDNSTLTATYTYENDLLKSIQTGSTEYTFTYGNFSLRTAIYAGQHELAEYTYTTKNNYLDKLEYGNGDSVQYTYDKLGRVTMETYEDGDTVTYKYDNNGALATVTDSATGITTTYYYDFANRLMKYVESSEGYSHSVGYAYDETNNLTTLVETINGSSYTTSYTYDSDNRVTSISNGTVSSNYTYDEFGRNITQTTKQGDTQVLYERIFYRQPNSTTATGQVGSIKYEYGDTTVTYTYTYDNNGNIASVSDGTYTTSYEYDTAGQLVRENNQQKNYTWVWEYDDAGNILSKTTYYYTTGTLGMVVSRSAYEYADTEGWGDLLTSRGGQALSYDEIGNLTNDGIWNYTWEHGRELASMANAGETWTFTYDANGMRTSRSSQYTTYEYVYNGGKLMQMTSQGTNAGATAYVFNFFYDASGTPTSFTMNGATYYYVTNLQGDVIAIVDSSGTKTASYSYDAWGNATFTKGSGTNSNFITYYNPLLYRGYVYDYESGLYYLRSRYYDPEMGRFINADAYVSTCGLLGNNMFAYCLNNPVNKVDYSGNIPGDIFETMDEAAKDAAEYMEDQGTFENSWEYITVIYEIKKLRMKVIPSFHYIDLLCGTENIAYLKLEFYYETTYSYTEISTDFNGTQVTEPRAALSSNCVAVLHTHPYIEGEPYWKFSPVDILDVTKIQYLYTAGGILLKYDPNDGSTSEVYTNLPKDPHLP